jgi:formate dehydrogenase maturation protein FdhE
MELSGDFSDVVDLGYESAPSSAEGSGAWATRQARALQLAARASRAEETLLTYAELLPVQARVAEAVPTPRWLALVSAEAGPPRLRLDRLPVDELVPLLADFLAGATSLGTDGAGIDLGALSGTPGASWLALLGSALTPEATEDDTPFHIRAFLQPVATTLAAADRHPLETVRRGRCLTCGGAPAVGALQDLPGSPAVRTLICGVCGTPWRLPTLMCAYCGEDGGDALVMHASHSHPWVRVEECKRCGRYLKNVDVRQQAAAVPLVDDIATPELDLWARARGLRRVQRSLFGI